MRKLIFILSTLLLVVGCKQTNIDERPEPSLDVATEAVTVDYKQQEIVLEVSTNQTITVKESAWWLMVEQIAEDRIVLSVMSNDSEQSRECEVTITAAELSRTVRITQLAKPEIMRLSLGHTSTTLASPEWSGDEVRGTVDWGDGSEEEYREGISHQYSDNAKRTATFDMQGATSFKIDQVGEIECVEITL